MPSATDFLDAAPETDAKPSADSFLSEPASAPAESNPRHEEIGPTPLLRRISQFFEPSQPIKAQLADGATGNESLLGTSEAIPLSGEKTPLEYGKAAINSGNQALSGLTSLSGIETAPLFLVPGGAEAYAAKVATELPQQGKQLKDIYSKEGLSPRLVQTGAGFGLNDLLAALGLHGAHVARAELKTGPSLSDHIDRILNPEPISPTVEPQSTGEPNATQEISQQTGVQVEPQSGTEGGQAEAPSVSDSLLSPAAVEAGQVAQSVAPEVWKLQLKGGLITPEEYQRRIESMAAGKSEAAADTPATPKDAETPNLGTTGAGAEPAPETGSEVLGSGDGSPSENAVPQDATAPVGIEPETTAPQNNPTSLPDRVVSGVRRIAQEVAPAQSTGLGISASDLGAIPGVKEAVNTWADRVRSLVNVGDSVKRFIESGPQRDTVSAKFDAANNQAGYIARQARRHVQLSADEGKPNTPASNLQQQAATFVRQANGDKAGMIAKLNAIRGKGYDNIIDYAVKNWDSLEKVAEAAKQGTDAAFLEAQTAGVNVDYRDNYVKGAYHDPVTQKVVFDETGGGRGTGASFNKAKVFNDYAEAIKAGFKPKELRLDALTESAVNSTLRAVNRKKWAGSLGEFAMPDGLPAVAPAKENGSAPRGYQPVQVTPGNLVNIHNDLAPTIEALTANSAFPKLLSHGGAFLKHNILVFDIFHGSRFAQMQAAFEAKIPSYHKGLAILEYSDKDLAAAQKNGLITSDEAQFAQANRPKLEGLIGQGLNAGRISDALYKDAVPLMPGARQANNFIFDELSRGMITQSALYAVDRNARLHPEWTPDQLNRYTAKEVNTYYRNLGNQGVFKSKTFQDVARALVFAPQWIEGMVRSEARGYGQIGKVATTGSLGNVGKGMATGLVAYFALTQAVNLLTRGKPTWQNPEPGHAFDAWIPDSIQGSNGFFVSPLSVFAETTHEALKYSERGEEPLDVASQLVQNKLHPQVRALRDLLGGKDFFGRPLHGMERVTQAAEDVAPIPLFARTGGYKGGAERQLLSTLGIKATAAPSSTNDIYQLASDFKRKQGIKQPDQFETSDYSNLRKALQQGDNDSAQAEYDKLSKLKGRTKVAEYFKNFTRRPFTGSKTTEDKFRRSLDRGQLDIYNSALREREEISQRYQRLRK